MLVFQIVSLFELDPKDIPKQIIEVCERKTKFFIGFPFFKICSAEVCTARRAEVNNKQTEEGWSFAFWLSFLLTQRALAFLWERFYNSIEEGSDISV